MLRLRGEAHWVDPGLCLCVVVCECCTAQCWFSLTGGKLKPLNDTLRVQQPNRQNICWQYTFFFCKRRFDKLFCWFYFATTLQGAYALVRFTPPPLTSVWTRKKTRLDKSALISSDIQGAAKTPGIKWDSSVLKMNDNSLHTHTHTHSFWLEADLSARLSENKLCWKQNREINFCSNMTIKPVVKTHISVSGQSGCSSLWCTTRGEQTNPPHRHTHTLRRENTEINVHSRIWMDCTNPTKTISL